VWGGVTRNYLTMWKAAAGDPAGAATVTEAVLADMARAHGHDHPDTLIIRSNLAAFHADAGDPAGAAAATEELLAVSRSAAATARARCPVPGRDRTARTVSVSSSPPANETTLNPAAPFSRSTHPCGDHPVKAWG